MARIAASPSLSPLFFFVSINMLTASTTQDAIKGPFMNGIGEANTDAEIAEIIIRV